MPSQTDRETERQTEREREREGGRRKGSPTPYLLSVIVYSVPRNGEAVLLGQRSEPRRGSGRSAPTGSTPRRNRRRLELQSRGAVLRHKGGTGGCLHWIDGKACAQREGNEPCVPKVHRIWGPGGEVVEQCQGHKKELILEKGGIWMSWPDRIRANRSNVL